MNRLLLTFANRPDTEPLPTLRDEDTGVWKALSVRDREGAIRLSREQHATIPKIIEQLELYKKDVCLFLYSGHAGRDSLLLEDGKANARGLALLLEECARYNLKVVVLNGCSTEGQVAELLTKDIPLVIATNSPVNDFAATRFSIAFFKALAESAQPLWEAFLTGLRAAQTVTTQDLSEAFQIRSIGRPALAGSAAWGLYCRAENRGLAETWKLPEVPPAGDCPCNQHLRKGLSAIYNAYLTGLQAERTEWPKCALERLPFPISEPLRKLLAGKAQSQEANLFYDTPSRERFRLLLYSYHAILTLPVFALLADLWDNTAMGKKTAVLPENMLLQIKDVIFSDPTPDLHASPFSLLKILSEWYNKANLNPFLPELEKTMADLQNRDQLRSAISDLESKITIQDELLKQNNTPSSLCALCDTTEENLSKILFAFGFMVRYGLTSVKDIGVLKFRQKSATFLHRVVKLQIAYMESEDERYIAENYLETSSVVLHPYGDWSGKPLNLTPFYIDKNAMLGTSKANLHYLYSAFSRSGELRFRRVSQPDEVWIVSPPIQKDDDFFGLPDDEKSDEYYLPLREQIEAFTLTLFGKSPGEL